MIHELIQLTRPFVVFDLETTGTDRQKDRIVELGFQLFTHEGKQKEWRTLVNPEMPIPPGSIAKHHITDEDVTVRCRRCRLLEIEHPHESCTEWSVVPKFGQIAENIAKGFSGCDFGGKNIRFDLGIMVSEMKRVGVTWSYAGARIIDNDRLEQLGEPRTLSHLYKKHTGKELTGAHGALADIGASVEILCVQLVKYGEILPRDLDALHQLQWPGWIDGEGQFRFDAQGVPCCSFGKHRGKPMSTIPPDYWQWMLKTDFGPEIKKLASDALVRKYPVKPPQTPG